MQKALAFFKENIIFTITLLIVVAVGGYYLYNQLFINTTQYLSEIDFSKGDFSKQIGNGWYGPEQGFCWTEKTAHLSLALPADTKNASFILTIKGFTNIAYLDQNQVNVTIKANGKEVLTKTIQQQNSFVLAVPLTDSLPSIIPIDIKLDRTFIPNQKDGKGDTRKLGIAVQDIKVEPYQSRIDFALGAYDNQIQEGWYGLEQKFRWTTQDAKFLLARPGDVTGKTNYNLKIIGFVDAANYKQKRVNVKVKTGDQLVGERIITSNGDFTIDFAFQSQLPNLVPLEIILDDSFIPNEVNPASNDARKLGIAINRIELTSN